MSKSEKVATVLFASSSLVLPPHRQVTSVFVHALKGGTLVSECLPNVEFLGSLPQIRGLVGGQSDNARRQRVCVCVCVWPVACEQTYKVFSSRYIKPVPNLPFDHFGRDRVRGGEGRKQLRKNIFWVGTDLHHRIDCARRNRFDIAFCANTLGL